MVAANPGVVGVIKGNGYGFGRARLAALAVSFGLDELAVGTVHELAGLPDGVRYHVLTPLGAGDPRPDASAILTVGSAAHVEALTGWGGSVLIKLESSMRRYGGEVSLAAAARRAGLDVHGFAVHLPLATSMAANLLEVESLTRRIYGESPSTTYVSHLDVSLGPPIRHRIGTRLWLGDKSFLHLGADVIDTRPVTAGQPVGYRQVPAPGDGTIVMVSAGTAHGVYPLDDGRSPFHFARQRLALIEPPHMHTSMLFAASSAPAPEPGDVVDVQRPLTQTWVDQVVER